MSDHQDQQQSFCRKILIPYDRAFSGETNIAECISDEKRIYYGPKALKIIVPALLKVLQYNIVY